MAVANPLTNPVPGAWLAQSPSAPAVYVPHEPLMQRNVDGKEVVVGHGPGAHYKRLLSEGWMIVDGPDAALSAQAFQANEERLKAENEALQQELEALRAKMAQDAEAAGKRK